MFYSNTIFGQLLNFLPKYKFNSLVGQHKGDDWARKTTAWNQFVVMLHAQATGKESLREIETGFKMHKNSWHHLGVNTVAKSSISDANNRRSYKIFKDLFYVILGQCKDITGTRKFDFENPLYSFDSSTISLCLNMFDWAKYTKTKGAFKLHILLNNRTTIPELLNITEGNVADITAIKQMILNIEKGSILVFDRAYIDYEWWQELDKKEITFVSRAKSNQNIFVTGQHKKELKKGVIADEIVIFGDYNTIVKEKYPKKLRRVKYYDEKTKKEYTYLTNNFTLTALQIANIYKDRWQIEIFFKWIKQNLRIKNFLGTSKNAVLTQVWIAMIYYLLLAYIKFQTKFEKSLLTLTRMIKETIMFRRNLIDMLSLDTKTIIKFKPEQNPQQSFW